MVAVICFFAGSVIGALVGLMYAKSVKEALSSKVDA